MKQDGKSTLIETLVNLLKVKNPNLRYDIALVQITKLVNQLDDIGSIDTKSRETNLLEADEHLHLARRDIAAAEVLTKSEFNAWSLYITNKAVERIFKGYSAMMDDASSVDIGHKYTEWLLSVLEGGALRHIANVMIAVSGVQVSKNEMRNRLRSAGTLRSYLSRPNTPQLRATETDVRGYLKFVGDFIDLLIAQAETAITSDDIREIIAELIKAFDQSHLDQDTVEGIRFWKNVEPDHLREFFVQQSVIYVRLLFLGLLLQPHDVPSRYTDQDDVATSPFDYDGLRSDATEIPGIITCSPEIWTLIDETIEVTQDFIDHQRAMLLE